MGDMEGLVVPVTSRLLVFGGLSLGQNIINQRDLFRDQRRGAGIPAWNFPWGFRASLLKNKTD